MGPDVDALQRVVIDMAVGTMPSLPVSSPMSGRSGFNFGGFAVGVKAISISGKL